MDAEEARKTFKEMQGSLTYDCPLPMNKQKGDKAAPAYFTGIINMLARAWPVRLRRRGYPG